MAWLRLKAHPERGCGRAFATFIESRPVQHAITALIVINAAILALETSPAVMAAAGGVLHLADRVILAVFVVEILLKVFGQRGDFLRDPWNYFDTLVVGIALVPGSRVDVGHARTQDSSGAAADFSRAFASPRGRGVAACGPPAWARC